MAMNIDERRFAAPGFERWRCCHCERTETSISAEAYIPGTRGLDRFEAPTVENLKKSLQWARQNENLYRCQNVNCKEKVQLPSNSPTRFDRGCKKVFQK